MEIIMIINEEMQDISHFIINGIKYERKPKQKYINFYCEILREYGPRFNDEYQNKNYKVIVVENSASIDKKVFEYRQEKQKSVDVSYNKYETIEENWSRINKQLNQKMSNDLMDVEAQIEQNHAEAYDKVKGKDEKTRKLIEDEYMKKSEALDEKKSYITRKGINLIEQNNAKAQELYAKSHNEHLSETNPATQEEERKAIELYKYISDKYVENLKDFAKKREIAISNQDIKNLKMAYSEFKYFIEEYRNDMIIAVPKFKKSPKEIERLGAESNLDDWLERDINIINNKWFSEVEKRKKEAVNNSDLEALGKIYKEIEQKFYNNIDEWAITEIENLDNNHDGIKKL